MLPRQAQFHAAARECDRRGGPDEVGFGGARGPGKSHAMLAQIAVDDCQRVPGLKCLLLRKVGKAVRESFEDLRRKVLFGLPHRYNKNEGVLTFENDSRIVLGHFKNEADIDAYLGLEYDAIGVEEATTLSFSKYKAIRTCCRTAKADWRPRTYSNANPGGIGHAWYKQRFIEPQRRGCETTTRFFPGTIDDNPFVNVEYRRTLDDLTGWVKRAWRWGDWDIAAGQFFTTWRGPDLADSHVIAPFPLVAGWTYWCAMDYGFTHYTVVYLLVEDGDGTTYVVDEHAARRWLVPRHVEAIGAMVRRAGVAPEDLAAFVAGPDVFARRGTELTIAEQYARQGIDLSPAPTDRVSGAAEVLALLGDVEAGIRPRLRVFDRCRRLVECIPVLQHDPHRPEDVLKVDVDEDGNGGDDAYDALRYGVMGRPGLGAMRAGPSPTSGWRG